jgi:anti-sigma factor RsiW
MKPCFCNRKLIAWLALGELDAPRAEALYAHMRHCPGCRCYLEEMSAVAGCLAAGPPEPELEPSASFHHKLLGRLRREATPSAWAVLSARLNWRLALPALGAAALLLLMLSTHPAVLTPPVPVNHLAAPPPAPASDLSPTVANYERAASGSLDEFDHLLTQQARQHLPSAPNFTATFALSAGASD